MRARDQARGPAYRLHLSCCGAALLHVQPSCVCPAAATLLLCSPAACAMLWNSLAAGAPPTCSFWLSVARLESSRSNCCSCSTAC